MKRGPNVWVVCRNRRFTIKEEGRATTLIFPTTQREAIRLGRRRAKWNQSELIIQGRNGQIRAKDSHGNDDFPPRG
jgi:hypothetical protein